VRLAAVLLVLAAACPAQNNVHAQIAIKRSTATKGNNGNAVVWLTPLGATEAPGSRPAQRYRLTQRNKQFEPHLLVVPVGASVDFPKQDPFFHNVFSLYKGKRFDLGLYEAGESRAVRFDRPGISFIFCNIHPEMSGVVIAMDTPYFAVSDQKGMIEIKNVPAGRYEMKIWHERILPDTLKTLSRPVVIAESASSLGVLRLIEDRDASKGHKNKYGQDYDSSGPGVPGYKP